MISPACQSGNPIQQVDCQAKLGLYQAYMIQLGGGVTERSLPPLYRDVLGPHYSGANLTTHRFGYSNRQPPNNATTDCSKTYYNDATTVNRLAAGILSDPNVIRWVLHELAHVEQCVQVGGRDYYAKLWFNQLGQTQISVTWPPAPGALNWMQIHDQMAMEQAADDKRDQVWQALTGCCIDQNGLLIRPLAITSLTSVIDPATATKNFPKKIFTVQTSGGAAPLSYQWQVKKPGMTTYANITAADGTANGNVFTWSAMYSTGTSTAPQIALGSYGIQVKVSQAKSGLPTEVKSMTSAIALPNLPTPLNATMNPPGF